MSLKSDQKYWYQVMGQLRVDNRKKCYFVVHTNYWTEIQEINYDEEFWKSKMFDKLNT